MRSWMKSERFHYIVENLVWVWLAAAALLTGAAFFADPSVLAESPLGRVLHPWDYVWNALWIGGGSGMLVGILAYRPEIEVIGQSLFSGALLIYVGALLLVGSPVIATAVYPALIAASLGRVYLIVQRARAIRDARPDELSQVVEDVKRSEGGTVLSIAAIPLAGLLAATAVPPEAFGLVVTLLAAGGGYSAYKLVKPQRDVLRAEVTEKITSAADRIISRQQEQLEQQQSEIRGLRERIVALEEKVLHQQATDAALARAEAARDAAESAVARLNHRVEQLVDVLQSAGVHVSREELLPPRDRR